MCVWGGGGDASDEDLLTKPALGGWAGDVTDMTVVFTLGD